MRCSESIVHSLIGHVMKMIIGDLRHDRVSEVTMTWF